MNGRAASCATALLLAILLGSCATERTALMLNTRAVPVDELVSRVNARAAGLQSMTGRGSLWFEGQGAAGSAFFTMSLRKPDSLLVRLKGPFGMEVGLFFLSRDRYVIYNGMQNQLTTGVPSMTAIRSVLPVALTQEQIVDAFSGTFTIGASRGPLVRYVIDNDEFLLSFVTGADTASYWIDPESQLVTRYVVTGNGGRTRIEATAGNMVSEDSVYAPREVRLRMEEQQLSIQYSSLTLNAPEPSFAFSIPPGARTIVR